MRALVVVVCAALGVACVARDAVTGGTPDGDGTAAGGTGGATSAGGARATGSGGHAGSTGGAGAMLVDGGAVDGNHPPADLGPSLPPAPPAALRMIFPISGATTASKVTARGTTDGQNVLQVSVNGTPATSGDGFRTWSLQVALAAGANEVRAVMERVDHTQVQASASIAVAASDTAIKRGKIPVVTYALTGGRVDSQGHAMYLADVNADGVLRIDVATGDYTWATCSEHSNTCGDGSSNGVPFSNPLDLAVDDARQRAYVVDGTNVFAVDLSGHGGPSERTMLSGPTVTDNTYQPPTYAGRGAGPTPQQLGSIAYDPAADAIYAVDWGSGNNDPVGFFKIDPTTGDRTVFSPIGHGGVFRHADVDTGRGVLFTTAAYQSSLTTVKLSDGTRANGPSITEPSGLFVAPTLDAVLAWNKSGDIVAFEGSGLTARTVTSASVAGDKGPAVKGGVGLSAATGLIFIYESNLSALMAIDPTTGERVVVSR